jgi:hypothetical protein
MLETARLEYTRSPHPLRFSASLAADTLGSLLREHLRAASFTRPGYVAAFALFFSLLLLSISVVNQQILRRRAESFPTAVAKFASSPVPDPHSEAIRENIVARFLTARSRLEISSPAFLNRPLTFVVF